jgi:peptidoglycan hydrolase CwlO-like protein|tara:strand:+ start:372 stop:755 length:384 start_codon:yes stop_codon:yes gene_type:complete
MATTNKDILENILEELSSMKNKLPNGELKRMETTITEMKENYTDIKEDLSDIKYTLLNPDNGVIVRVNKNTEVREDMEQVPERILELENELEKLQEWKSTVSRALWVLFSGLIGLLGWIFSEAVGKL